MVADATNVLRQVKELANQTFSRADLSELVEPFTSRLEYFMKAVVFPTASRRSNLATLIDDLPRLGVSPQTLSALHELRKLYNLSKHDPDVALNWSACLNALTSSVSALSEIAALKIGAVDAPHERDQTTRIYAGFWDHYTGGETEIGLFLPSNHWLGTSPIATFHMPMEQWDTLKLLLSQHPLFTRGREALGEALWESFSAEGDFLDGGVWEGDARELLFLLSPFNDAALETAVLPPLARRNSFLSIGLSVVSAAVDVVRANPNVDVDQLRSLIARRCVTDYAANLDAQHGQAVLTRAMQLLANLPADHRARLSGPAFRRAKNEAEFESSVPLELSDTTFVWLLPAS
jgi:hypothetical protein